jgi:hypothetical protein
MNKLISVAAVAVVLGGALGFYGGMQYKGSQVPSRANFAANFRNGQNGGMTAGKIISKDAQSITIQMQEGSRIVFFSGTTDISKMVAGSAADLAIGTDVTVRGTQNADGSLAATSIQLRAAPTSPQR